MISIAVGGSFKVGGVGGVIVGGVGFDGAGYLWLPIISARDKGLGAKAPKAVANDIISSS
jgi:hypothetical protein